MEKEKNPMDSIENLSEEELKKEADSVRKMIDQSPELQNITVPEEVHQRLAERIRKYEEEKALGGLSEKDREALRIGREIQRRNEEKFGSNTDSHNNGEDDSENKKIVYRPKKKKMVFVLAAVLLIVFGMGLTTVGRKNIVVDVFQKTFGSGEKTYVDTEESTLPVTKEGMSEEEAYAEIEKVFGTKVVQMTAKPDNMKFLEMQLDQKLQEATLYYVSNKKIFSYCIMARYSGSSSGINISDTLIREYTFSLLETDILVSEYKIQSTGELQYTANFTYKNSGYYLQGVMEQKDFEKIIKNLLFF